MGEGGEPIISCFMSLEFFPPLADYVPWNPDARIPWQNQKNRVIREIRAKTVPKKG